MTIIEKLGLRPDETVRAVIRRHWIYSLRPIAVALLICFTALFLMYPLVSRGPIGASVFAALLLVAALYGTREWVTWYRTIVVFTSERVIDVDQKGYFSRLVSEAPLDRIQDVSYGTQGVLQTVFGVGSITVRTVQNALTIGITWVRNPEEISTLLQDLIRERTGATVAAHREKQLSGAQKRAVLDDVLHAEELDAYADYRIDDLIAEYTETFGEDRLKKLLVDELDREDEA